MTTDEHGVTPLPLLLSAPGVERPGADGTAQLPVGAPRCRYSDPSASFGGALLDLMTTLQGDVDAIKERRTAMKVRLEEAAAVHGIDPPAVRRLLAWRQQTKKSGIEHERNEEIDAAYRAIVIGKPPLVPSRLDSEIDKVLSLISNDQPPRIEGIMKAIACSRGKASKLRGLAVVRLAAKSSRSSKSREPELSGRAAGHVPEEGGPAEAAKNGPPSPLPTAVEACDSWDAAGAFPYVRGTDPASNEQIAFECIGLAVANAKAAELRMGGYRDVILSLVKAPEADDPAP